ncbi:MAG: NTP transferase domain-containing protein [Lachnospiraceae bacterium]|nr:NTP transferase domain-containing protein [Lachnospiraceae bacterium]
MKSEELSRFLIMGNATVVEAMQKIDLNSKGILFIIEEEEKLVGVVTDGDIRRWLIRTGNLQGEMQEIMNRNPKVISCKERKKAKEYMAKHLITALPVVTRENKIKDIIFKEESNLTEKKEEKLSLQEIPVVIMAGGKGTRLYPYTRILPKPLIPIGDIPIMERIINAFREYGVKNFYATVNYRKSMIKSYFSENIADYQLTYVEEDKPLGTAGSLPLIQEEFHTPLVVTNCDILIHADYTDIYKHHLETGNELTIVTALKNIVVPYGVIHSSENGRIQSMEEKPKLSYFVNTGMYVLSPKVLQEIPEDTFFHMTDLADQLLAEGRKVGMYPISEDSFLDMGEFEEMRRMEEKLDLKAE